MTVVFQSLLCTFLATSYDIGISLIDLRHGLKDENVKNHKLWEYCSREIDRCYVESHGLFFLSLQGDKYGFRPLSRTIEKSILEHHLSGLTGDIESTSLIRSWYTLDSNAIPPEFVLHTLNDDNQAEFDICRDRLLVLLSGVSFDQSRCLSLQIGQSVTEWEHRYALALCPQSKRRFWLHRHIESAVDESATMLKDFFDQPHDTEARSRLQSMKREVSGTDLYTTSSDNLTTESNLDDRICRFAISAEAYASKDSVFDEYRIQWFTAAKTLFDNEFDNIKRARKKWLLDGNGLNLSGAAIEEMLHHCKLARMKSKTFYGRQAIVTEALRQIYDNKTRTKPATMHDSNSSLRCITLALVGGLGTGKTSLMAKLAEEAFRSDIAFQRKARPIIIRFCGTSPDSSNALRLVLSIAEQILLVNNAPQSFAEITSYDTALQIFRITLKQYPVILFIDALDQLSNVYQERSQLTFLRNLNDDLHPDSHIIVSTVPDERDPDNSNAWIRCYKCQQRLLENQVPIINVQAIHHAKEKAEIVTKVLEQQYKRRLNDSQMRALLGSDSVASSALYLKLACRLASEWKSTDLPPSSSSSDPNSDPSSDSIREYSDSNCNNVDKLVLQLFQSLQNEFGTCLTRRAFALITFSVDGITDTEMQDILSTFDDVMTEVFQYSTLETRRLPYHVWIRLRGAIDDLLAQQQNGCLRWYHRQIREVLYTCFAEVEQQEVHAAMGQYFSSALNEVLLQERKISDQPMLLSSIPVWFDQCRINYRRCIEAGVHLIESELFEQAIDELCTLDNICAHAKTRNLQQTLTNLVQLCERLLPIKDDLIVSFDRLKHYIRWLQHDLSTIIREPAFFTIMTALQQPEVSCVHTDCLALLSSWEACSLQSVAFSTATLTAPVTTSSALLPQIYHGSRFSLHTNTESGSSAVTGSILSSMKGHQASVESVAFDPSGKFLVSGSQDSIIRVWEVSTSAEIVTLKGHKKFVKVVAFSPTGQLLASLSTDNSIILWDCVSEAQIQRFIGLKGTHFTCMAFSSAGDSLITGSDDGKLLHWQLSSGTSTLLGMHLPAVTAITCHPNGELIASGGLIDSSNSNNGGARDSHGKKKPTQTKQTLPPVFKAVKVWNIADKAEVYACTGHYKRTVRCLAYSPDGQSIAIAGEEHDIILWSPTATAATEGSMEAAASAAIESGEGVSPVIKLSGHRGKVLSIAYHPTEPYLASGGDDHTLRIWDTIQGTELLSLLSQGGCSHDLGRITCLYFSPDGMMLASGSDDHTIKLWDVEEECSARFGNNTNEEGEDCDLSSSFLSNQSLSRSMTPSLSMSIMDFSSAGSPRKSVRKSRSDSNGTPRRLSAWSVDRPASEMISGKMRALSIEASSGSGKPMLSRRQSSADSSVLENGSGKQQQQQSQEIIARLSIEAIAFDPYQPSILAIATTQRRVDFWDMNIQAVVDSSKFSSEVISIAFAPSSSSTEQQQRRLAVGLKNGIIFVKSFFTPSPHDTATATATASVMSSSTSVAATTMGSSCPSIAIAPSTSVKSHCRESARSGSAARSLLYVLHNHEHEQQEMYLISGHEDRTMIIWHELPGGGTVLKETRRCVHEGPVNCLAYSSFDGGIVASGSVKPKKGNRGTNKQEIGTVLLWEISTGICKSALTPFIGYPVLSIACSDSSMNGAHILACGSGETKVIVYDLGSLSQLYSLDGQKMFVRSLAFSPDGSILASCSGDDQRVQVWDMNQGSLVKSLQGHDDMVQSIIFSVDGKILAAGGKDGSFILFESLVYENYISSCQGSAKEKTGAVEEDSAIEF